MTPQRNLDKYVLRLDLLKKYDNSTVPRIILIQAPAGYGKTVLAKQIVQHIGKKAIWQTIDSWQRDIVTITHNITQGIMGAFDKPVFDGQILPSTGQAAGHYLAQGLEQVQQDCVLVFDDIQNLLNYPAAVVWLQTLLDYSNNISFILVGQQLPNVNLLQFIARGEVLGYGLEDLKFSYDETVQLLQKFRYPEVKLHEELVKQFDGWIAGIRMGLQPLPDDVTSNLQQGQTALQLFHQLSEKLFRSQSPDLQDFLLKTSLFDRFTIADCYQAMQLQYANEHLEQILEQNLFLIKEQNSFYYHALFKEFLQNTLKENSCEEYFALQIRIADYYLYNGREASAIQHYIDGEAFDKAASIAERIAASYHIQGKWQIILKLIEWLEGTAETAPTLWLMAAIIETDNYHFKQADALLFRAEHEYQIIQQAEGVARVLAQRAFLTLRQGKLYEALQICETLLNQTDLPDSIFGWVQRVQGIAFIELRQFDRAISALLSARNFAKDRNYLAMVLQDLSSAYVFSGNLDAASQILQELVAIRRQMKEPLYLALALNSLGYHYHCCSEYGLAKTTLEEGLSSLSSFGHSRVQAYLLWSLADLDRDCGRWHAAEQGYQQALQANLAQDVSLQSSILISLAHLRIWQQRWEDALLILRDAEQYIADSPQNLLQTLIRILRNLVLGYKQNSVTILVELQSDFDELNRMKAPIKLSQVLGLYLWLGLRYINIEILHHVEYLLAEIHAEHPIQALAADIFHIPELVTYFRGRKMEFPRITEAIGKLREEVPTPIHQSQQGLSVSILDIQTLGEFRVIADGRPIPQRLWGATAARELFLYLYFHGSQRREDLALLFWPDMSASRVRSNFHTTLYRAREALGETVICYEEDRYFINPSIKISSDAQRIRHMIEQARPLSSRNAHAEDLYWRVRQIYQGQFLPDIDRDWVIPLREELSVLYHESLLGLAKCAQAREDYRQAVQYYQDAVQASPYDEEAYRGLMLCFDQLGDKPHLLQTYNQLRTILNEELALEPSKYSATLFQELIQR